MKKPHLSFWQIWNMSFGFFGIQFGFALQNANVSRIFETLGADKHAIPLLWIAAPLTGLVVQPIVGYFSDRTWCKLGRRRPYFLGGAVCASLALIGMPNSSYLWMRRSTYRWSLSELLSAICFLQSNGLRASPCRASSSEQVRSSHRPCPIC